MLNRFLSGLPFVLANVLVFRVVNAGLNAYGLHPEAWILSGFIDTPTDAWVEFVRWLIILILAVAAWGLLSVLRPSRGLSLKFDRNSARPLMHSSPFIQVLAFTNSENNIADLSRKDFFVLVRNNSGNDTVRNVQITLDYIVGSIPIPIYKTLVTDGMKSSVNIDPKREQRFFFLTKYHSGFLPTGAIVPPSATDAQMIGADLTWPYKIVQPNGLEPIMLPNQEGECIYAVVSGEN